MKKQGILFQGLPVFKRTQGSVIREESFFGGSREGIHKRWPREYMDVTYFLLYAMCGNPFCMGALERMEEGRKGELLKLAENSEFQDVCFWQHLGQEEFSCAKYLLGLLEEIRHYEDERGEFSWVGFWYLVRRGFPEVYQGWKEAQGHWFYEPALVFPRGLKWNMAELSVICMELLSAEDLGIEIKINGAYGRFCMAVKECSRIWNLQKKKKGKTMINI